MRVALEAHNPEWIEMFKAERFFLQELLADWLFGSIEHVGSTAIPNIAAKPIIDIMVGVQSLNSSRDAIEILEDNGYCYADYKSDVMHWFCKPSPEFRTHHLHLVPYESQLWTERIQFRDVLLSDRKIAQEYSDLKVSLAKEFANDREAYTEAKWPFIQRTISASGAF